MTFQTELTREEEPYPSNCTKHWSRTIYEELAQNFVNNETIKVDYSLAVSKRCQTIFLWHENHHIINVI